MNNIAHIHRDDEASKLGMWLFIFTELLLFAGLFIVYGIYRYLNPVAFHLAAEELSVTVGTVNTVILLISSATMAMASTAIRLKNKQFTILLLLITLFIAFMFMTNKYFEWKGKFEHGIFPGSEDLLRLGHGDTLFFSLYFFMTGLHALHIIVGFVLITIVCYRVNNNTLTHENPVLLDNSGLYWHLVDLIWIFLFPLFYLIT
ncbi:MAG: cytochrome c oxidase subunit 3 family protein [Bacteroidales bacterium]|nr:cytochrome c oxidase subunit 3 family protein [Bacteroidales bacterium]